MTLRCFYILLHFLLLGTCTKASAVPAPVIRLHTVPGPDTATTVIPFTKVGSLMVVQGSVDSISGNFILDTGAPYLVLNLTYFRHYPHAVAQDEAQTSVNGTGSEGVLKTKVGSFQLGRLQYNALAADLVPLGHIEDARGIKVLGLLGMELWLQCEMIIDFDRSLIYLRRVKKKDGFMPVQLRETERYRTLPFVIAEGRMIMQTELAGRKMRFIVDCAAETNLLHSKLPQAVYDWVTITRRVKLTGSGSKKVEALYGDLKSLKVGGEEVQSLPVLITNLENTCFGQNGCVDGVLGFDFLSLHQIGFNFVTRKMYIWK